MKEADKDLQFHIESQDFIPFFIVSADDFHVFASY